MWEVLELLVVGDRNPGCSLELASSGRVYESHVCDGGEEC